MRLTVRVPATSANLGPGFDCFGLALDMCNEVIADTAGPPGISWHGEGAQELSGDGSDLVNATMRRVAGERALPAVEIRAVNRVPLARGLGSSSAAVVAGVVTALALLGDDPSADEVFSHAASLEGHPDNAAPACFGGFTIATPDGLVRRLDPHPDVRPVLLVPDDIRVATREARAALPDVVPLADAVFNIAHGALLVEALARDPSLLGVAMRDRLHEEVRLALVPAVREVFDAVRAAGVPVCVSGSGPTLIAFPMRASEVPSPGPGWSVSPIAVRTSGFEFHRM